MEEKIVFSGLGESGTYDGEYLITSQEDPAPGENRLILAVHLSTLNTSDFTPGLGTSPYDPYSVCASPKGWELLFDWKQSSPLFKAGLSDGGTTINVTSSSQLSPDGTGHNFNKPD